MNIFNRLFMILLSLAALAFSIITLLLLFGVITPEVVSPNGILRPQWNFFRGLTGENRSNAIIVCGTLAILSFLLLMLELRRRKRRVVQPRYSTERR